MQRTHHSAETRAVLRAVDARNEVATTLNTSTAHSDADTITADPVRVEGGPTTRCELSQRVDQQTGSGQYATGALSQVVTLTMRNMHVLAT